MKHLLHLLWILVLIGPGCTPSKERTTLLEASPRSVVLPREGGEEWVELQTDGAWTSEVSPPIAREWLTAEPASGGAGPCRIQLHAESNPNFERREATLYFDAGELSQTVTVVQAPTLVSAERLELPAFNSTEYLTVGSISESFDVTLVPQVEWCVATIEASQQIRVRALTNLGAERRVTLHVTADGFSQDIEVIQQPFDA